MGKVTLGKLPNGREGGGEVRDERGNLYFLGGLRKEKSQDTVAKDSQTKRGGKKKNEK